MGTEAADWLVPRATGPTAATIRLPGSKSMTNRALVLAALATEPTVITGPLLARDTQLMADALGALGCRVEQSPGCWHVLPGPAAADDSAADDSTAGRADIGIDVGNAGTVLRFIPPVATLADADVSFTGDERAAHRPVVPLLDALRTLGARITCGSNGHPPGELFLVRGQGRLRGGAVTLDASASSQLISGLLLAAPRFDAGAEVSHHGPPVPSAPHIEMTVRMLRACGAQVDQPAQGTWRVAAGPIAPGRIAIEPDLSNAAAFLAAALVTGGAVTVAGWPAQSLQPASQIIGLLTSMGADVRHGPGGLTVRGHGNIRGVTADLGEIGELTPVLTALAALASSPSQFRGIGHLRRHESDRLAALAAEIGKLGGDVTELPDGLRITPRPLRGDGVVFDSHDDHRLVMAAAVLGLAVSGIRVRNAATASKTFPGFSQFWSTALVPAG